jgi:hypothetical protein
MLTKAEAEALDAYDAARDTFSDLRDAYRANDCAANKTAYDNARATYLAARSVWLLALKAAKGED